MRNTFYIFKGVFKKGKKKKDLTRDDMWPNLALYRKSLQTSDLEPYKFLKTKLDVEMRFQKILTR